MASTASRAVIQLEHIKKEYLLGKNVVSALKDISLEIHAGEYVILYGPSGCGKSTLLNTIAGLEIPTTGKVKIRGEDLSKLSTNDLARHRREKIGMVFQQFNLLRSMTIVNNVALPELFRGERRSARVSRAKNLLKEFGLENYYNHKPPELSGGQQQRVAIARALANNPWILLADEPTGNVDSKTAEEIMEIFHNLNRKSKRTILLVTHNPDYLHYADRVMYMRDGSIIKEDRQLRSATEIAMIRRDRNVRHMVREYKREELDEKARTFGLNPERYTKEEDIAHAILEQNKDVKPEIPPKTSVAPSDEETEKPTLTSTHRNDTMRQARDLARKHRRQELDALASDLGIDPNAYKKEVDLAKAILEKQQS